MHRHLAISALSSLGLACGSSPATTAQAGESDNDSGDPSSSASSSTTGDGDTGDGDTGDGDGDGAASPCTPPIPLVDTSSPDTVVGNGNASSCTDAALRGAISDAGVITFDCGPDPVTIAVDSVLELRLDADTTIDGGGLVTLDGGDSTRIFSFDSPNFRATTTTVTLQRLTLQNARAPATDFVADPGGGCAWGYRDGQGGAVYVRDGVLHVIDSVIRNSAAASPGPDTGGGAIYAVGSLDVTVVGSRLEGNSGSNSGAIGLLQSTGTFVNVEFDGNAATGSGANYVEPGCPNFNHDEQGGAGGNGGAMAVDGVEETELLYCGCTFLNNTANEFGGAVFRTPNTARQDTTFRRCTIDGNSAGGGGGLYISNSYLTLVESTVSNNTATGLGGGVRTERTTELELVNDTFYGNVAVGALAGALSHSDGGGIIQNCTFAANRVDGGPGFFTAAIRGDTATVTNTLFMDNITADEFNPMQCFFSPHPGADSFQWPRTRNNSAIDDTECVAGITWLDAELGALQDNGGPTLTVMPSAAVIVGAGGTCPGIDQRGELRPATGCSAGAVEP